ncbi:plasmid replication protein RepC [Brucella pseudogrignonensis]|nr:plasmid replication protein RepC [Brucella pseudogrignonensis]
MQVLETLTAAVRSRMVSRAPSQPTSAGIKKWELYKNLCVAKSVYGLNDRCLTVLNSLLSFLADEVITTKSKLVVFPSNKQIAIRAHMMPESTLRRHLTSLIEAGIITRKDSPNGKRYAHKNGAGEVALAFGFDFTPFFARASEIKQASDRIQDDMRAVKRLRDEVSVLRRALAETFDEKRELDTNGLFTQFRNVVDSIPRRASLAELTTIKMSLEALTSELAITLKNNDNVENVSANDAQYERHHRESLSESLLKEKIEFSDLKETASNTSDQKPAISKAEAISLDLVLRVCPDISTYATSGIRTWRDLVDASRVVSSFLGISHTAYIDAIRTFGLETASAAIAAILQKAGEIASPGGYLRSLVQKAKGGGFSVAEMMISGLKAMKVGYP